MLDSFGRYIVSEKGGLVVFWPCDVEVVRRFEIVKNVTDDLVVDQDISDGRCEGEVLLDSSLTITIGEESSANGGGSQEEQ